MKILVTGAAGFIGYHITKKLIENNHDVVGLDNINDYYDINLKIDRLFDLGIVFIDDAINSKINSNKFSTLSFYKTDLSDSNFLEKIFKLHKFECVCHLAAQAGVRYSLKNPYAYVSSNLVGFHNIIENVRNFNVKLFLYASSSSVYGNTKKIPFKLSQNVDKPISLYAATKKSNELIAFSYSHLYGINAIGLRFFTVYGPWGRPDMAYFSFTNSIFKNKAINVYNNGNMRRDFTYIDDIVEGIFRIITEKKENLGLYRLYNIGNNRAENLNYFIDVLEKLIGKKAKKIMCPIQPGDVLETYADIHEINQDYNFKPVTKIEDGLQRFISWYKTYYKI